MAAAARVLTLRRCDLLPAEEQQARAGRDQQQPGAQPARVPQVARVLQLPRSELVPQQQAAAAVAAADSEATGGGAAGPSAALLQQLLAAVQGLAGEQRALQQAVGRLEAQVARLDSSSGGVAAGQQAVLQQVAQLGAQVWQLSQAAAFSAAGWQPAPPAPAPAPAPAPPQAGQLPTVAVQRPYQQPSRAAPPGAASGAGERGGGGAARGPAAAGPGAGCEADGSSQCVICWEREAEVCLQHGDSVHLCACQQCAESHSGAIRAGQPCPMCQQTIEATFRLFGS
jgi:hypothetical protein